MKKSLLTTLFIILLAQSAGAMLPPLQGDPNCLIDLSMLNGSSYNEYGLHFMYAMIRSNLPSQMRLLIVRKYIDCGVKPDEPYRRDSNSSIYDKVKQLAKQSPYYQKVLTELDRSWYRNK